MKKNFCFWVILLVMLSITGNKKVLAQDFNLSASTSVLSSYVAPNGLQNYALPVNQGNVTLSHKSGFFVDLWYSTEFNNPQLPQGWGDEIDYTAGWSGVVFKSQIPASFSLSYFDNNQVLKGTLNDVIKGTVEVNLPVKINLVWKMIPYYNLTFFIVPNKDTPFNGGILASMGWNNEIKVNDKWNVNPCIQFSTDNGAFSTKPGFLFKPSIGLNYKISDYLSCNASITYYDLLWCRNMDDQCVAQMGISWKLYKDDK